MLLSAIKDLSMKHLGVQANGSTAYSAAVSHVTSLEMTTIALWPTSLVTSTLRIWIN